MRLKIKRDKMIESLPPMEDLVRGSLLRYYHEGCPCHPKGRYGPYWYLSVNVQGRTKMRKLEDRRVPLVRQALKNYQRWWKTALKIMAINTELTLSKED